MNINLDNRVALIRMVEKMDAPDFKQLMAFAAGYEAGLKACRRASLLRYKCSTGRESVSDRRFNSKRLAGIKSKRRRIITSQKTLESA